MSQTKLSKTDAPCVKFAMIFANDKGIWQIYIYDINVEKNGVTDAFDIKMSHTAA